MDALQELGQMMVQDMTNYLLVNKKSASRKLVESINFRIEDGILETINLNIYGEDYGKWVNVGRKKKAKRVPISALIEWATIRGLETGEKKLRQLAFAIQTNIWKKGIKPTPFIEFTLKRNAQKITDKVAEHQVLFVSNEIDKLILKYRFDKVMK